jgi:hypothetical protein
MSIRRITISVPEEVAVRIKKAAKGTPVSAWLTERITEHFDDQELDGLWQDFVRDVAPTAADTRKAEALYARLTKPTKRRRAA